MTENTDTDNSKQVYKCLFGKDAPERPTWEDFDAVFAYAAEMKERIAKLDNEPPKVRRGDAVWVVRNPRGLVIGSSSEMNPLNALSDAFGEYYPDARIALEGVLREMPDIQGFASGGFTLAVESISPATLAR